MPESRGGDAESRLSLSDSVVAVVAVGRRCSRRRNSAAVGRRRRRRGGAGPGRPGRGFLPPGSRRLPPGPDGPDPAVTRRPGVAAVAGAPSAQWRPHRHREVTRLTPPSPQAVRADSAAIQRRQPRAQARVRAVRLPSAVRQSNSLLPRGPPWFPPATASPSRHRGIARASRPPPHMERAAAAGRPGGRRPVAGGTGAAQQCSGCGGCCGRATARRPQSWRKPGTRLYKPARSSYTVGQCEAVWAGSGPNFRLTLH